jgi:membrane protease subunit HflC
MKNLATVILALVIILVFTGYMVTYQVDFNEVAVVQTFGAADDESVHYGADGRGEVLGNLYWRWIWPIQKVYTYDARVQVIETRLEETQTADNQAIIPSLFVAWRIDRPLLFNTELRTMDEARKQLLARLRDAKTQISTYTFDELTHPDPEAVKLDEAEDLIRGSMQQALDDGNYGIEIASVGIKRLVLPQDVTQKVFERMRATRQRLAQKAESEGVAAATDIRGNASSARERILSFADLRADQIRAEGRRAVAGIYQTFKADEEFASFQRSLQSLERMFKNNATILADPRLFPVNLLLDRPAGGSTERRPSEEADPNG